MERHDSPPQASCSHVVVDAKLNLLADCLLASVKVLMNLTNVNSVGCRQIAVCGGLETLCGLIAGHYPSFSSYLPNFSDQGDKLIVLEGHNKRLNDQELDFLVAILVLLVNLVKKDGRNRSRLAGAIISIPTSSGSDCEITDIILFVQYFWPIKGLVRQLKKGGNLFGTTRIISWREKTIVEAYSALLLAFISTERFDCSADARSTSFLSLSFVNTEKGTHPLWVFTPSYIPTYELVAGHQVYFELPGGTSFYVKTLRDSTVKLTAPSPFSVITFSPFASAIEVLTSLSHAVGTVFMPPKWSLVYVDQTMVGKRRKSVEDEEGQKEKKKSEIMLVNKLEREWQQKMNANNSVLEKFTDSRLPP